MSIGKRIELKRKELGITIDELAQKLEKNRATIYRYENGDIENLPAKILNPLAQVLGTTPQYLMGWDDSTRKETITEKDQMQLNREEQELLSLFNRLDNSDKNKLLGYLSGLLSDDKYKKFASVSGM